MKNRDLVAKLQQLDPDLEVAVLDFRRNQIDNEEEDSAEGLYLQFDINAEEWLTTVDKREPFIALTFYADFFVDATIRKCRVCGCTDDNCLQCIQKTGQPCHWVEDDLCSACVEEATDHEQK